MGRVRTHPMLSKLDRDKLLADLDKYGYTIIPNAVDGSSEGKLQDYQEWYAAFKESGDSIRRHDNVIDEYRLSHFDTTWQIRANVRQLFGRLWGTEKLLSSVEGVILFNPPEKSEGEFRKPEDCNLRIEQSARREGVHAYRGAVFLEESTSEDFCFRVLTESHKLHTQFFKEFPKEAARYKKDESRKLYLSISERTWYFNKGCNLINVPVPKGGLLLWDARMVFDFVHPECGRPNIDRWTCIALVTMTPALWADKEDLEVKSKVFKEMLTTTHWPSQNVKVVPHDRPLKRKADGALIGKHLAVKYIPSVALWYPCQKLAGVMEYNMDDAKNNGPPPPTWK